MQRLNVVSFVIGYYVKITQTFPHVMRNPCQMPVFCYTIVMMLADLYKLAHFVYENIYSIGRIISLYFYCCCCRRCCCCCCCCCFICLALYLLNETMRTLIRKNKSLTDFWTLFLNEISATVKTCFVHRVDQSESMKLHESGKRPLLYNSSSLVHLDFGKMVS